MSLKVISIDQPYASLIMTGVKRWETRGSPPNGDMRPDGVRGLPGLRVDAGERVAVAATLRKRDVTEIGWEPWKPLLDPDEPGRLAELMSFGAILGTVEVSRVVPVVWSAEEQPGWWPEGKPIIDTHTEGGVRYLILWNPPSGAPGDEADERDISDQVPYGHWTPGGWAWELADPIPTTKQCPWPECEEGSIPALNPLSPAMTAFGEALDACPVCDCEGSCPPIPVKGKQGVWEWTP